MERGLQARRPLRGQAPCLPSLSCHCPSGAEQPGTAALVTPQCPAVPRCARGHRWQRRGEQPASGSTLLLERPALRTSTHVPRLHGPASRSQLRVGPVQHPGPPPSVSPSRVPRKLSSPAPSAPGTRALPESYSRPVGADGLGPAAALPHAAGHGACALPVSLSSVSPMPWHQGPAQSGPAVSDDTDLSQDPAFPGRTHRSRAHAGPVPSAPTLTEALTAPCPPPPGRDQTTGAAPGAPSQHDP